MVDVRDTVGSSEDSCLEVMHDATFPVRLLHLGPGNSQKNYTLSIIIWPACSGCLNTSSKSRICGLSDVWRCVWICGPAGLLSCHLASLCLSGCHLMYTAYTQVDGGSYTCLCQRWWICGLSISPICHYPTWNDYHTNIHVYVCMVFIRPDSIDLLFLGSFLNPFQRAQKDKNKSKRKNRQKMVWKSHQQFINTWQVSVKRCQAW